MARTQSVVPPVDLVVWLGLFLTPRLEEHRPESRPDQTEPNPFNSKSNGFQFTHLSPASLAGFLPTYLPSLCGDGVVIAWAKALIYLPIYPERERDGKNVSYRNYKSV